MSELLSEIKNEEIKVVAFDFFDTIVHRKCHPEVVLYQWSRQMTPFLDYKFDSKEIYNSRKKVEKESKEHNEEVKYKDLMFNLFEHLKSKRNINVPFEDFYTRSLDVEEQIELENIYINKDILPILNLAIKNGKEIIVISDFYFEKELFVKVLENANIKRYFTNIFISSEINARKSTGSLYKSDLKELNISSSEMIMIGDNKISDYKIPKALNIESFNIPFVEKHERFNNSSVLFKELKNTMFDRNEYSKLNGYIGAIYFFLYSLDKNIRKENNRNILFCSREGQLLKYLFDLYQNKVYESNRIHSNYFCVSRKSTLSPSLRELDEESFEIVFRHKENLILNDFLKTLSFNDEERKKIYSSSQLSSGDVINKSLNNSAFHRLKDNKNFVKLYDDKRNRQRELFKEYVNGFSNNNEEVTLVDIGWSGSMQDNINSIFGGNRDIMGYYFGLLNPTVQTDKSQKRGLVFSNIYKKTPNFRLFSYNYMIYERIFVANHGPVNGYKRDVNGKVIPIVDNRKEELVLFNYVKPYQQSIVDCFSSIVDILNKSIYSEQELFHIISKLTLFQECVKYPKNWMMENNLRKDTIENFGDISGEFNKRNKDVIKKKIEKGKYLFVDYAYKIPQKMFKSNVMNIFSLTYCYLVYGINVPLLKTSNKGKI